MVRRPALIVTALVILLRLPFLDDAVQGDDLYYLYGAQHAQVDPLHPLHTRYTFSGEMVDMRGHPHGPLNAWVLGALLAVFGEVRETAFHATYIGFSLTAALAMLALARRFAPERALWATLLFIAVPAFVVNGNSLEADLPFLAFWMLAVACFARAVDTRSSRWLGAAALAAALAALDAFQAVLLTPILGLYLWLRDRRWLPGWIAALAAPATIAAWQAWEWASSGVLPAAVLLGYMQSGSLQSLGRKLASAAALTAHAGWIVCPPLVALAFARSAGWWRWAAVAVAAGAAAWHDPNPLFWASIAAGVLLVSSCIRREFLAAWVVLFFAASLVIFFAGSARYLLPLAAPVAILIARPLPPRWLATGFAVQLALGLGLETVNAQHWAETRAFASEVSDQARGRRVWVNGEWGLRHYLEARGARPLLKSSLLRPGDLVATSELSRAVTVTAPTARLGERVIAPRLPLRVISIEGGSGYSAASKGLLPFEISREVVDRLTLDMVLERTAELSYLDPRDARAAAQVLAGLYSDGWTAAEASVLLKAPAGSPALTARVYIPPDAPARRVTLLADGVAVAEQDFPGPGAYTLAVPLQTTKPEVTVGVRVDATHRVPPDSRELGVVVIGIGFKEP